MQAEVEALFLEDKNREREAQLRRQIDTYLDAGHGSCDLQEPEIAACVVDTWRRFDGERYRLLEWVVMPNHCHVLIEQLEGVPLGKIVLSWKNYTARFINVHRGRTGVRRTQTQPRMRSRVWQREYWDRFIRDERHFEAVKDYIVMNPVKAGLVEKPEDWFWSSARDRTANDATRGEEKFRTEAR
jgi:REP element-mobilizing transposase RayT